LFDRNPPLVDPRPEPCDPPNPLETELPPICVDWVDL
jgi:hypothetical protein